MKGTIILAASVLASGVVTAAEQRTDSDQNWHQWRGPEGNGISWAKGLPTVWGPDKNIVWKTPLPSWSGGTPIVWGDRIFVTSASKGAPRSAEAAANPAPPQGGAPGQGRRRFGGGGFGGGYGQGRDPGGPALLLICVAKKDGKVLWERELDTGNRVWMKQNASSPSPVTDGKIVWVVTGTGAVTAFDMDGKQIWKRNLQKDYGNFGLNWGYASSPLYHDGKLIIEVLHGNNTDDPSYIVALNGKTGAPAWKVERATDAVRESPDAYTTPALLVHNGKPQIVISGGDYVTGHDPETGRELWRAGGLNPRKAPNYRIVASPVVKDGMIFAPTRNRPLLAVRAGGSGDVTETHVAWKWEESGGPDVPTPISDGKYFYMVDDRGMVTCLDAKTGKLIWGPERTAIGTVSASPLLADGKLYIINESAVTTVLEAGPQFKVISTNELDGDYTLSSFAVSGKNLFIRTGTHLYNISGG